MDNKERKSPFYVEMMNNGKITFPQYYELLCGVWEKEEENRKILIKAGVANKNGMLDRKDVSLEDAYRAIDALEASDMMETLYEIGYISKDKK